MNQLQGRKVLVITHQLSSTGAPFVLLNLIQIAATFGIEFEVVSMQDGVLRTEYEKIATVYIQKEFINEDQEKFVHRAEEFDLVFVNTLIPFEVIHLLKGKMIPVVWWIHESESYFDFLGDVLPDFSNLESNIMPYGVSPYVEHMISDKYQKQIPTLLFGMEDIPRKEQEIKRKKVRFLIAGTISYLKGQDILLEAIQNLEEDIFECCEFIFCGDMQVKDEKIYEQINHMSLLYPNISIVPSKPQKEFLEFLEQMDCLIVPSRMDTVSSVAVEMFMKQGICICSDACGVVSYLHGEEEAYVFESKNAMQLTEKIESFFKSYQVSDVKIKKMKNNARKIYETYFSKEVFEEKIKEVLTKALDQNKAYYKVIECIQKDAWDEGIQFAMEMIKTPFSDKQAIVLASINLHFNDRKAAFEMIQKGLSYNPNNYELYFMLGNYFKDTNNQKACDYYEKALLCCNDPTDRSFIQKISEGIR